MQQPRALFGSLAARLLLLGSVPLFALTFVAQQRIADERVERDRAQALVEVVDLHRAVTRVYAPTNIERIAMKITARIDELGYPREIVMAAAGFQFQGITASNRQEFMLAVDDLDRQFGWVPLATGTTLGAELDAVRAELDVVQARMDEGLATPAEVSAVFQRLDQVLVYALDADDTFGSWEGGDSGLDAPGVDDDRLRPLTVLIDTAGGRGRALLRAIIEQDNSDRSLDVVRAEAAHLQAADYYRSLLDPADQAAFDTVTEDLAPIPVDVVEALVQASPNELDLVLVRQAAELLDEHQRYMRQLAAYVDRVQADLTDDAVAVADVADRELRTTAILLLVVGSLTVGLVVLGTVATLRPMQRLRQRAESISAGTIDAEALPVRGAADLRALTRTTNEMTAVLAEAEREIRLLADGDLDEQHEVDLPGTLGASLQASINRLHDITVQLKRSEQLASAIVDGAADAIWTTDAAGTIVSANDASERLIGLPEELQAGRPISDFVSALSGSAVLRSVTGDDLNVLVSSSGIGGDDRQMQVVIAHDMSERVAFERQLALQARRDPLTTLPNRLAVLERIDELVRARRTASVLYVDLDGFKGVNDLRGHATGDDILREVARRLRAAVPEVDLVGRLGGDEFVVVSTRVIGEVATDHLGRDLITTIEQPFDSEHLIKLSASIGVVEIGLQPDAETVLSEADSALYQAKRRGKRRVEVFDRELQEAVAQEAETELALRRGIPTGELELYLQPVIDLRSGRIDGAEALVRWRRADRGLVPPAEFIPIAERSSLIIELDRWVLGAACARIASWKERTGDTSLRLAVNVSGRHLIEGNVVADVVDALHTTGADPTMLELELTETHLLEDLERAVGCLEDVRALGVRISIDDFGTGYSALNHLRRLPIDAIKIDRSFVVAAATSETDAVVVDAVLAIGRSHGLEVVAEGIETIDHLQFARDRGCDRGQGYLIARPVPADEAELLILGRIPVAIGV